MRLSILTAALLAAATACSSGKLTKSTAETLIKADYPAVAPVRVSRTATVDKGSERFVMLQKIHAALQKEGYVEIQSKEEGSRVTYTCSLTPKAPASTKTTDKNFQIPAAEVQFVRIVRVESGPKTGRAAYEVTLAKPLPLFPLFQMLHPGAQIGQTKVRVADFHKQDGRWELLKTDESFAPKG
jgi:hypothetical protein